MGGLPGPLLQARCACVAAPVRVLVEDGLDPLTYAQIGIVALGCVCVFVDRFSGRGPPTLSLRILQVYIR